MKSNEFVKAVLDMKGFGYVLGGQGELYTPALARKWGNARQGGEDINYFTKTAARWFGHRVVDCSGLIIQAIRTAIHGYTDQTANGLYSKCKIKGPISEMPELPGVCVHKPGHIGVYLGGGKVLESRGVAYGVVITNLKNRPWTGWGELADIDYTVDKPDWTPPTFHIAQNLRRGMVEPKDTDEIKAIQRNLKALGYYPGDIDGDFGPITQEAVYDFQEDYGLLTDAVVGPVTTRTLGGKWDGK